MTKFVLGLQIGNRSQHQPASFNFKITLISTHTLTRQHIHACLRFHFSSMWNHDVIDCVCSVLDLISCVHIRRPIIEFKWSQICWHDWTFQPKRTQHLFFHFFIYFILYFCAIHFGPKTKFRCEMIVDGAWRVFPAVSYKKCRKKKPWYIDLGTLYNCITF